jgi:hypothetical protein
MAANTRPPRMATTARKRSRVGTRGSRLAADGIHHAPLRKARVGWPGPSA